MAFTFNCGNCGVLKLKLAMLNRLSGVFPAGGGVALVKKLGLRMFGGGHIDRLDMRRNWGVADILILETRRTKFAHGCVGWTVSGDFSSGNGCSPYVRDIVRDLGIALGRNVRTRPS